MSDEAIDTVIVDSLHAHVVAGVTTVRDLSDRGFRTLTFPERPGLPLVAAGARRSHPGRALPLPQRSRSRRCWRGGRRARRARRGLLVRILDLAQPYAYRTVTAADASRCATSG